MTGEEMNRIYVMVCLGKVPVLDTQEKRKFYESLVKEMSGKNKQWAIPSE